jgi:hypothetical protein
MLAVILSISLLALPADAREQKPDVEVDVVVYGGTASGVAAGIQAARMGRSVVVLEPGKFIGGMTTGGLGATDNGANETVSGIALELYRRVWDYYLKPEAWQHETREEYLPKHGLAVTKSMKAHWFFEPHVASNELKEMLDAAKVTVVFGAKLDRKAGVRKEGNAIREISMLDGKRYAGKVFIDATYEGDLMAAAGVKYAIGREANSVYGETVNGIHLFEASRAGHIDPYIRPGDPSSGLLPRVEPKAPGKEGEGDHRVQAYCFRMCLTDVPENRMPLTKPGGYDALQYEATLRNMVNRRSWPKGKLPFKLTPMPNRKTDSNNSGMFSTDYVGHSYSWAEASYEEREKIFEEHKTYTQGLFWFLANDERVPSQVRESMAKWGVPKDEFTDNDHWPHQLYVREARRMVGEYVMTEADCVHKRQAEDNVGFGSYAIDSHHVSLFVDENGKLRIDGGLLQGVNPYVISYRSLLPKREQCTNLLVPICASASHAAYGSMRMEPVFMMLGQSAGTAAALSIQSKAALHDLPYAQLKERLLADGLVLSDPKAGKRKPKAAAEAKAE